MLTLDRGRDALAGGGSELRAIQADPTRDERPELVQDPRDQELRVNEALKKWAIELAKSPGRTWRLRAHDETQVIELENRGTFDELVVDHWLHVEQMDEREWVVRIGEKGFTVTVRADGDVVVEPSGDDAEMSPDSFTATSEERVAHFAERVELEPEAVRNLAENGRYLSVNPMADEENLLTSLGIAASSCTKVDLYWELAGDVKFVQIQTMAYAEGCSPGIYARVAPTHYINVVIVVENTTISSVVVADALKRTAELSIDERTLTAVLARL